MTKLSKVTLALAASLLATGALGQSAFTQHSESVTVAEELFGDEAGKLEFKSFDDNTFTPKSKLIFANDALAENTTFTVTFTFLNAELAERASRSDLMWGSWGPDLGADCATGGADEDEDNLTNLMPQFCERASEVNVEIMDEGGAKGDSSVTYEIEVTQTGGLTGLAVPTPTDEDNDDATPDTLVGTTRKIVLLVPDLEASGLNEVVGMENPRSARSVMAWISVRQPSHGGTETEISEMLSMQDQCNGTDRNGPDSDAQVTCPLVNAKQVISAITNSGGGGTISLDPDDMRTKLVNPVTGAALDPQRITLSTVAVDADFNGVRDKDGDMLDGFSGELDGNLHISVTSDGFNDGDVVYIDADGDKEADSREIFSIDGNVASDSVDLGGRVTVYYVPNGKDALTHRTTFTTNARTEFADTANKTVHAPKATAMLNLRGIMGETVLAYAIAPLDSADKSNVRIRCEAPKDTCKVFLDCTDTMGENTFGDAGLDVMAGHTVTLQQAGIAEQLGIDDWEGRLACELLSTGHISTQVLTRAAGVLVNNTYVDTTE